MSQQGLPGGFQVRPVRLVEADGYLDGPDVDLAFEVVRQIEESLLAEPDSTREAIRHQLSSPEAVIDEHRLVLDESGRPVGFLLIEVDPVGRYVYIEPCTVPGSSLLPALVEMGLAAAERLCGSSPGWMVDTGAYAADVEYQQALRAAGFTEVRRFWRMRIDFDGPVPEPEPPRGVSRSVAATEADRRLLHSILESAFADHFGSVPQRYETWLAWFEASREALPSTWWLAWLDGEPVAAITQDASRASRGLGYVRTLGVLPAGRRRGIAAWLLKCAFADAAQRGLRGMGLGVDSENASGAVDLYTGVGMHAEHVIDKFRRPIG